MEDICIRISARFVDLLKARLRPEEFAELGRYVASLVEKDLRERPVSPQADLGRERFVQAGAVRDRRRQAHNGLSE
jgi:hypothetical protein